MDVRTRHDALIRTLRRRGLSSVGELAEEVGTSRRTVLRDIATLRDQGFVIHSEPGRGGGVRLDPGSIQTTSRLSVTEMFGLLVSVGTMRAANMLPFADLADAALAKIERTLPAQNVADLRQLLDRLHVGTLSPDQDVSNVGPTDPALHGAFEDAFLERRMLTFTYRDAKGTVSHRTVEPQAMLALPPLWYLVGWDPAKDDFRHFRMDRIAAPEVAHDSHFRRRYVPFENDVCPYHELAARRAAERIKA